MAEIGADGAVVALDADDAVGDAERLCRLATMRPGGERAVLLAHAGGARCMADLTGGLAGDDLVRLSGLPVEVEHQLEGGGEAAGPVARHAGALVPNVEAEPAPALFPHPLQPVLPVRLPFAL